MVADAAKEAILITNAYASYIGLDKHVSEYITVKHTEGNYVTEGDKHTNNMEGYCGVMKRAVYGIYHSVSAKHLQRYCSEFGYRNNCRKEVGVERFTAAVKKASDARITYKLLTKK